MANHALIEFEKSTSVRFEASPPNGAAQWSLKFLRGGLSVGNYVAPDWTAARLEKLFFTPRRFRAPAREEAALATGEHFKVGVGEGEIAVWKWGSGPRVYLLHGWSGRAGQLASFVEPLVARGYSVIAFDAPAHGLSDGEMTSALEVSRVLRQLIDRMGPAHAVIGHSMGGWAVAFALYEGAAIGRAVLIGSPTDPAAYAQDFARMLSVNPELLDRMRRRAEKRLGFRFVDLDIESRLRDVRAPALIMHDLDDREVPASRASQYEQAWRGSKVVVTEGLGHHRILRNADVVQKAVNFVDSGEELI